MSERKQATQATKPMRTVREVIDEEWMTIGDDFGKIWTREELEEHHRAGDFLCERLAPGYTLEQINEAWDGKSTQEILAKESANKALPRIKSPRARQRATLNRAS